MFASPTCQRSCRHCPLLKAPVMVLAAALVTDHVRRLCPSGGGEHGPLLGRT